MPLSNLLSDLFDDIYNPAIVWQAGIIVVCIVAGWALSRMIRGMFATPAGGQGNVVQYGVANFGHVLTPLLIMGLIALAKLIAIRFFNNIHLLRLALPIFGSLAVIRIAFYLMRRVFARHGPLGAAFITFEKVFALLVWAGFALYITGMWAGVFQYLDTTTLPLGKNQVAISTVLQAIASVAVLLMLALWAGAALEERLMGVHGMHASLRVVLARMSRAVLIVIAVLLSLSLVGIDLTVLSVFGGALGVGLGLGLQKIASNYVSGFVILLERSLAIGDMISVDKFSGKVTQINTRYTVLHGLDGTETVVPNEMLISGPVQNLSLSTRQVRISTKMTVAFDTNLADLMPKIVATCRTLPRVLAEPEPAVALERFGTEGFELDVSMWIADPENGRGGVLSDANLAIWTLFQREGVTLPYPTRELRFADSRLANLVSPASVQ
ncbi:MAG: mechanosensitive ion channel domain-containing protein [Pseudomonadota bacterium]